MGKLIAFRLLARNDFKRILTEPEHSLIKQYKALLETEGITLNFLDEAIETLADLTVDVNKSVENIGARRLHTMMEKLLDDISFSASDLGDEVVTIDKSYVEKYVGDFAKDNDLSKFIL